MHLGFTSGGLMRFRISARIWAPLVLISFAMLMASLSTPSACVAAEENPLLVQSPTMSKTQIVFAYGGYLWSVPREGGEARQLTTGGHEGGRNFHPMEIGLRSRGSTTATSMLTSCPPMAVNPSA